MGNASDNVSIRLVLTGRVALEAAGRPVPVRRKGLALLAYLALEGPSRRATIADVLWRTRRGRANLRVELRRLNAVLGRNLQDAGDDPLALPPWIAVEAGGPSEDFLAGLEDVSDAFDEWLAVQRERRAAELAGGQAAQSWVEHLAARIRPPAVVLLRARPATDMRAAAQALAAALRLRLLDGPGAGERPSVRLLQPPFGEERAQQVALDRHSLWVVPLPAFGEESLSVLGLRSQIRPERLFEVEVPPLSWPQARDGPLKGVPFGRAAAVYLQAGGDASYLADLLESGPDTLPGRIHAAYLWEARHASLDARLALERLAVHPGPLPDALIDGFDARTSLDELERRGWLLFDGAWRFADPVARRVVHLGLQPGRKRQFHALAAACLEREGLALAAAYHRREAGGPVDLEGSLAGLEPWARRALLAAVPDLAPAGVAPGPADSEAAALEARAGAELALLEESCYGRQIRGGGAHWSIVRAGSESAPSGVVFETPWEPLALHLRGSGFAQSPMNVGLDGRAAALTVRIDGALVAVLVPGVSRAEKVDGVRLLPFGERIDAWLEVPAGRRLRLESGATLALLELEVAAYRLEDGPYLREGGSLGAPKRARGRI